MSAPDPSRLELLESTELPHRTLVAPIQVVRDIRLALGAIDIDIRIGAGEAVLVSSDLYEAFNAWDDEHAGLDAWLN